VLYLGFRDEVNGLVVKLHLQELHEKVKKTIKLSMKMNFSIIKCWPKILLGTFKNWIIILNVTKDDCNVEGFDVFFNPIALAFIIYVEFLVILLLVPSLM